MKKGLSVIKTALILNISTSYVYRLIREGELETVQVEPFLVSSRSVVKRLIKLTPLLEHAAPSRLDYEVRQHELAVW